MSRRIILFGPLPPPFGGVSIYMQALAGHLRDASVRIWAYTGATTRENQVSNVRPINHRRLGTFWALVKEGRGARILDMSHFHLEYPNALLLPVWVLLKPVIGFAWYKNVLDGSLPGRYQKFSAWQRFLFRRALKAIDEFVVVSEELKNWLQHQHRVQKRITVIPCLVPPLAAATELDAELDAVLAGYLRGRKQVCCIGAFIPDYGFAETARAVEALRRKTGQDIQLLLLDGAFARDDDFRADVMRARPWITVIEKVAHEKIPLLLKKSDVFVRATRYEGFGISRVEAIWSGIPVIATNTGETRGMRLFEFGDDEKLAQHLKAVLFELSPDDRNEWASFFRGAAENNLRELERVLAVDSQTKLND